MNKKIISLLISSAMILSSLPTVFAEGEDLVTSVKRDVDGIITVEGIGDKNEAVDIFVLNPGYDVANLNNGADTTQTFNQVVNYADVVYTGSDKLFEHTFQINNMQDGSEYVLYVKTDDNSQKITLKEENIYVSSTKGSDETGNGTKDNPYATIQKAKTAAADLSNVNPKNIIIEAGDYIFTEGLKFTAEDSGTESAPVTYKADGKVVITGAKAIDTTNAEVFSKVTDADILAKVPEAAKDNLYVIDTEKAGIKDVANFMAVQQERMDAGLGGRVKPMGVYLNGDSQQISQWPNTGKGLQITPASSYETTTISLVGVDAEKAAKWTNADNAYLDGTFRYGWYRESVQLSPVSNNTLTLKYKPASGVVCSSYTNDDGEPTSDHQTDTRVFVKNLLEEIDVPGEWYVNPDATKMYYYAPHTLKPSDVLEVGALNDAFVTLTDCDYITFDGIEFTKNASLANEAIKQDTNSQGMVVKNCSIHDVGGVGVRVQATETTVTGNIIHNIGEDGVKVTLNNIKTLEDPHVDISYNSISNVGMNIFSSAMCAVTLWPSYGVVVKNNTVRNTPSTALMNYNGPGNVFANNEIYNAVEYAHDAGSIYSGRSFINYGFTVKNNYLHDIGAGIERDHTHVAGIYLDDLYSGGIMDGNIIDMAGEPQSYGIINCAGVDNVIQNNTVVNAELANIAVTTRSNISSVGTDEAYEKFYYQSAFGTFLNATDYVAVEDNKATADVNEAEVARREAIMNIGKEGGPQWLAIYETTYPAIMVNYNKLVAGNYDKTDKIIYNVYNAPGIVKDAINADNVTHNTQTSDADGAIAKALSSLDDIGASTEVLNKVEKEFDLVYPANGATVMTETTYLKWEASDFADKYTVTVYEDEDKTDVFATFEDVEENYVEVTGLAEGTTYYWTVTAISESRLLGENTTAACSKPYSFIKTSYQFSPSYDATTQQITVAGLNKGEAKKVMMIATVKVGTELKAATTLNPNLDFAEDYNGTEYLTVTDEMKSALATEGAVLELYIWDTNMKALKGKTQLN